MPQMRKVLVAVQRIRNDPLARLILIFGDEAPSVLAEMPVHNGKGNNVFQTLEFSGDEGSMGLINDEISKTLLCRQSSFSFAFILSFFHLFNFLSFFFVLLHPLFICISLSRVGTHCFLILRLTHGHA